MAQPNNWQNLPLAALPLPQLQQAIAANQPHAPDHLHDPEVRRADGNAQVFAAAINAAGAPPPGQAVQPNLTAIDQLPEHQRNWGVVEQPNMNIMQLHAPPPIHPAVAQAQMLIFPQQPPEIFPS